MHVAAGTSLLLVLASSIMASHAQHKPGNLDLNFLKTWVPALVVGIVIGIFVMRYVSSRFLEQVFAIVILLISIQMFLLEVSSKSQKSFQV